MLGARNTHPQKKPDKRLQIIDLRPLITNLWQEFDDSQILSKSCNSVLGKITTTNPWKEIGGTVMIFISSNLHF